MSACTSLIIPTEEGPKHIQIITDQGEKRLLVTWYGCDETFNHLGPVDVSADEERTEEQYHTQLREQSAEKGHLITSHSTNPEWNPEGYVKTLDQIKEKNGSN